MKYIIFITLIYFAVFVEAENIKNVKSMSLPSSTNSSTPFLLKDKKSIWMSWTEKQILKKQSLNSVKVSRFENGKWSNPVTVVQDTNLMVNWADFPSMQIAENGTLYLNYLKTSSKKNQHGYLSFISKSIDSGKTWTSMGSLHKDSNPNAEHGFVTMVPLKTGVQAFWLDGGKMTKDAGAMELRTAELGNDIKNEELVDHRVCSCCGTVAVKSGKIISTFYRDRSKKEIRDIYVTQKTAGGWSSKSVSKDNWEIHGCPVNGPNADVLHRQIAMAWFSGGGTHTGVKVVFSDDAGKTFSKTILIDDFLQGSLGRIQVNLVKKDVAVVLWLKSTPSGKATLYARRVHKDGRRGGPVVLNTLGATRGAGFPQLVVINKMGYLVWTVSGEKEYDANGLKMISFQTDQVPKIEAKDHSIIKMQTSSLSKGEYIPNFSAKDVNGKTVDLSDYKGSTVLLNYWASWCEACIEEFGFINKLNKKYSKAGLKIILVNIDSNENWSKAKDLIKNAKLTSIVWRDPNNEGAQRFGYPALPFTALVDKHKKLRWTMVGSLINKQEGLEKYLNYLLKIKK